MRQKVIDYLNELSGEEVFEIARSARTYDGSFEDLDYWRNDEEFFASLYTDFMGVLRAVKYGNYDFNDEAVKIDAYGNLESANWSEVEEKAMDYVEEIADWLLNNWNKIKYYLDAELIEILEGEDEDE